MALIFLQLNLLKENTASRSQFCEVTLRRRNGLFDVDHDLSPTYTMLILPRSPGLPHRQ